MYPLFTVYGARRNDFDAGKSITRAIWGVGPKKSRVPGTDNSVQRQKIGINLFDWTDSTFNAVRQCPCFYIYARISDSVRVCSAGRLRIGLFPGIFQNLIKLWRSKILCFILSHLFINPWARHAPTQREERVRERKGSKQHGPCWL